MNKLSWFLLVSALILSTVAVFLIFKMSSLSNPQLERSKVSQDSSFDHLNLCSSDNECADSDDATDDICFHWTCYHVRPGECKPFAVKITIPEGVTNRTFEWWTNKNEDGFRSQSGIRTGTYPSLPRACVAVLHNVQEGEARCITPNGEVSAKALPVSGGILGCSSNMKDFDCKDDAGCDDGDPSTTESCIRGECKSR